MIQFFLFILLSLFSYSCVPSSEGLKLKAIISLLTDSASSTSPEESLPQEISIKVDGADIPSGGSYDFGTLSVGASSTVKTFTISNSGTESLLLNGTPTISHSGNNTTDFAITVSSLTTSISGNSSSTFTIVFTPGATGARTSTISISNNDTDEGTYTIVLNGAGATIPEINLKYSGTSIASGSTLNMGSVLIGSSSASTTLTIENLGTANLTITGDAAGITKSGANAWSYTLDTTGFSSPIAPSSSTSFTVTFTPTTTGALTATLTISNDDSDEASYTISLTGTGVSPPPPEINLKIAGTSYASGSSYYFGNFITSTTNNTTLTIENTSAGSTLTISSIASNSADFVVTHSLTTIAGSSTGTFTVNFTPANAGLTSGTLTITSDDSDEGTYTITMKGTGLNTAPAGCGTIGASGDKVIVVTNSSYNGNLGNIAGADTKCSTDANVTPYSGKTFKALVGANGRRITNSWILLGNTRYFNSSGDCIFKTDATGLFGTFQTGIGTSADQVSTGLKSDGSVETSTQRCVSGFTPWGSSSAGVTAYYGIANTVGIGSINSGSGACNVSRKLYCVEQ
jgi:trimeric autotransporter adhesin